MSNFKIIGESNPEVGKKITYSIADDSLNILPGQTSASANNPFVQTVHWSVYQLKRGQWVHKPNNDKTGNKVEYGFIEQTIEYDGLRIIAKRGEETAKLDIKTKRAKEGKILHIDLLDHEGNKPKKPFAYGQKIKAIVHCVNLDYCRGSATLWEDDELGRTGHNNANKKNNAVTLPFRVMDGKAEIDFLLHPDFNKMANTKPDAKNDKVEKEEGKTHEYYVTAQIFNQETKSSNTVEVNNLDVPIAPYKEKTTVQQKNTPKATAATTKKGVSRVFFTNTANQPITSVFKETQIKVWIISSGITGRTIRLKLFDEDGLSDDELFAENFKIEADTHAVVVPLNKIPRSKGGNYFGEGAEQEVYADIEVLQTHQHTKSAIVDVNASVFQPDPFFATNKKAMTGGGDEKENKKEGKCYCNKDLTEDILQKLAPNATQKNITKYVDGFNEAFKKFNINTCLKKIHFLAQIIHESGSFIYVVENDTAVNLANAYKGWHGRGLMQLTTKENYEAFEKAIGEDFTSSAENRDKVCNAPYAVTSAGWFWDERAKLNGIANLNDFIYVTYRINGGFNHIVDRLKFLKIGFNVLYVNCESDKGKTTDYKFSDSEAYNSTKASLAWGLWHDKNRKKKKDGCEDNDILAIEGYERFIELWDSKPPKKKKKNGILVYPKWYGISREQAEKNLNLLK